MKTLIKTQFVAIICLFIFSESCRDYTNKEIITLKGIENPISIFGSDQKLFITAGEFGTTIFEYSSDKFELLCSYGKKGEGSGKFTTNAGEGVHISTLGNNIFVTSFWKVSEFNISGKLVKEIRGAPNTYFYKKFANGFVGVGYKEKNRIGYYSINIYSDSLKLVKELYAVENSYNPNIGNRVLTKEYGFCIGADKIFTKGQSDEYCIEVFDINGNHLSTIDQVFDRINIKEENKNAILDLYKNHPNFKDFYDEIVKDIIFPEKLPAINQIAASDDYLYVITNTTVDDNTEIHILNHKGELINKVNIPLVWSNANIIAPLTVQNHTIFQLVESSQETNPNSSLYVFRL